MPLHQERGCQLNSKWNVKSKAIRVILALVMANILVPHQQALAEVCPVYDLGSIFFSEYEGGVHKWDNRSGNLNVTWSPNATKIYDEKISRTFTPDELDWLRIAFQSWDDALDTVRFTEIADSSKAKVVVGWTPFAFKWQEKQIGYVYREDITSIKLNDRSAWSKEKDAFIHIVRHELGNGLGLGDIRPNIAFVSQQEDPMTPPFGNIVLSDFDIGIVRQLYGESTCPSTFPTPTTLITAKPKVPQEAATATSAAKSNTQQEADDAAAVAKKAGTTCKELDSTTTLKGYRFRCIKSGSKLIWNKGVKVVPVVDLTKECKLPVADGRGDVAIGGWPRILERSKTVGDVVATVIMVDFPDAKATKTPKEAFDLISPAVNVFTEMSYGKLNYKLAPKFKWYRMSKNSSSYVQGGWTFESQRNYIIEATKLADKDVNFSKTDNLIILANPDAVGMGTQGPAFSAINKRGITLDGRYIANGTTSAHDLNYWKSIWLNHEISHTMGLVDLYAFTKENSNNPSDGFRFTGEFSFMGFGSYESNSPSLLAFERWNLGWIDDSQIKCVKDVKSIEFISPVQTTGGVKAVVIPISRTKAVVIESRRAIGLDKKIVKSGALVYVVDSSIQSGKGPVKVFPSDVVNDPRYLKAPRALGESVTVEGVTVRVVKSDESGDTVEISR